MKRIDSTKIELVATWLSQNNGNLATRGFNKNYNYTYAKEIGLHDCIKIVVDRSGQVILGDPLLLDTMTRQYARNITPKDYPLPFTLDLFNPQDTTYWLPVERSKDGIWERSFQLKSDNPLSPRKPLLNRFTYRIKSWPAQELILDIIQPPNDWQLTVAKKYPSIDGRRIQIRNTSRETYAIQNPALLVINLTNERGISHFWKLFAKPGDHWQITWDENNLPKIHTPYDPWNNEQLNFFWLKFRENRLYDQTAYFRERQDLYGRDLFIQWLEKKHQNEVNWLSKNPAPVPEANQLMEADIYYTYSLCDQFNLSNPFQYFKQKNNVIDTTRLYLNYAEEIAAYDEYIEAFITNKLHNTQSPFNPLTSNPSFEPITAFYYSIENFEDFARDHLMYKYARIIISNPLFDAATCQHIQQLFQQLVPSPSKNKELLSLLGKRKSLEKGTYFNDLKVQTPNGVRKIQDIISGPILIYNQYQDYHINPALIINIDSGSLDNLNIAILSKKEHPELAKSIADLTGLSISKIFVFQPASGESLFDTLYMDENNIESSIFTLLLDQNQKIYYAGPNRFASIYAGLQELKEDHQLQNSKLMQNVFMYGIGILTLFLLIILIFRLRERFIYRENARKYQHLQLKWQALTGQLNPHFLFNSLASIREMIDQNHTDQAGNYIQTFSNFLRSILKANRSRRIPLEQELEFAKNYLQLEQMRFHFNVHWNIDPCLDTLTIEIPPLLIQPYLENAIKHGIAGQDTGEINIEIKRKGQLLYISISDNGRGMPANVEPTGLGLSIGKERLETLYANRAKIHYTTASPALQDNKGTKIEVWIPIE
ncbi:MAG: histidine kinase [Saprospiraceae bacterium]